MATNLAPTYPVTGEFESDGFYALLWSVIVSFVIGIGLWWWGRKSENNLFRKEAMAVVGLTWFLATFPVSYTHLTLPTICSV